MQGQGQGQDKRCEDRVIDQVQRQSGGRGGDLGLAEDRLASQIQAWIPENPVPSPSCTSFPPHLGSFKELEGAHALLTLSAAFLI